MIVFKSLGYDEVVDRLKFEKLVMLSESHIDKKMQAFYHIARIQLKEAICFFNQWILCWMLLVGLQFDARKIEQFFVVQIQKLEFVTL